MSNYHTLRTRPIIEKPVGQPNLGSSTSKYGNIFVKDNIFLNNVSVTFETLFVPRITGVTYTAGNTTANTGGYETLTITGTGFESESWVLVDARPVTETNYVSSTELTFVTPMKNAGVYSLFVVNSDGSTGLSANGITYSLNV